MSKNQEGYVKCACCGKEKEGRNMYCSEKCKSIGHDRLYPGVKELSEKIGVSYELVLANIMKLEEII